MNYTESYKNICISGKEKTLKYGYESNFSYFQCSRCRLGLLKDDDKTMQKFFPMDSFDIPMPTIHE